MTLINVPKVFIEDHRDRDLDTPIIHAKTARHFRIDPADPAMPELISDAEYYAGPYGPDAAPPGLASAARALLRALGR